MRRRWITGIALVAAWLALATPAFAQGCAMCKTLAEAQGPEGAKTLDLAILVLLIPTVLIFVGILLWGLCIRDRSWIEDDPARDALFPPRTFLPPESAFYTLRQPTSQHRPQPRAH